MIASILSDCVRFLYSHHSAKLGSGVIQSENSETETCLVVIDLPRSGDSVKEFRPVFDEIRIWGMKYIENELPDQH